MAIIITNSTRPYESIDLFVFPVCLAHFPVRTATTVTPETGEEDLGTEVAMAATGSTTGAPELEGWFLVWFLSA